MTTYFCDIPKSAFIAWNAEKIPDTLTFLPRDIPDCNILVLGSRDIQDRSLEFRALRPNDAPNVAEQPLACVPLITLERSSQLKCLKWCGRHAQERIASLYEDGLIAAGSDDFIDLYMPSRVLQGYQQSCEKHQFAVPTAVRAREDCGRLTRLNLATSSASQSALTCCDFDLLESFRMATGTSQGSVSVLDLQTGQKVSTIDVATSPNNIGAITSLRWHPITQDVFGATASNGTFHVLRSKSRKPLLTVSDPNRRRMVSGCVWFDSGKNVVVAYDDDRGTHPGSPGPVIQLWDLRHTAYPLREVASLHKKGIVGMDICKQDSKFFTTASRDGRCLTWAMTNQTILAYSEVLTADEITDFSVFQDGSFSAVALQLASDKIEFHSIDGCQCKDSGLKIAPNWLSQHQNSVDFGFGGQLAWFTSRDSEAPSTRESDTVLAASVTADAAFVQSVDQFASYLERYDLAGLCSDRHAESKTYDAYEARVWDAISVHVLPPEHRAACMISKLGIDQEAISSQIASFLGHRGGQGLFANLKEVDVPVTPMPANDPYEHDPQDTTDFFEKLANSSGPNEGDEDGGRELLNKQVDSVGTKVRSAVVPEATGEGFFTSTGPEAWNKVPLKFMREAFLIGNPLGAVEIALKANRYCEAFILAQSIQDPTILKAVTKAYLDHVNDSFVTMLALSADQAYAEIVRTCSLTQWEEVMAFLVTYVYKPEMSDSQFKELATMLGARLEGDSGDVRAAALVYLFAGAFDQALRLISTMPTPNRRPGSTAMKITILRMMDPSLQLDSCCFHKVSMFIDRLVNNGRLKLAQNILGIIKGGIPESDLHRLKLPGFATDAPMINVGQPLLHMEPMQPMNAASHHSMNQPMQAGVPMSPLGGFAPGPTPLGQMPMMGSMTTQARPSPMPGMPSGVSPMLQHPPMPSLPPTGMSSGISPVPPMARMPTAPPMPQLPGMPPMGSMPPPTQSSVPPLGATAGSAYSNVPPIGGTVPPPPPPSLGMGSGMASTSGNLPPVGQGANMPSLVPGPQPPLSNAPPMSHMSQSSHQGMPAMDTLSHKSHTSMPPMRQTPQQSHPPMPPMGQHLHQPLPPPAQMPGMGSMGTLSQQTSPTLPQGPPMPPMTQVSQSHPSSIPQLSGPPMNQMSASSMGPASAAMQPIGGSVGMPARPAQPTSNPNLPINQISTHPAASIASSLQKGMPTTPWPIPTEAQQKRSMTSANERLNQQVQQAAAPAGTPCAPQDVQRIRESISAYMNSHSKPGEALNTDYKNRLNELCDQLLNGRLTQQCQSRILDYAAACTRSDKEAMLKAHQEMTVFAWTKETKHWLMMLKRVAMLA